MGFFCSRKGCKSSSSSPSQCCGRKLLSVLALFVVLAATRTYYSLTLPIIDCDETFNYWEPAFALLKQQEETIRFERSRRREVLVVVAAAGDVAAAAAAKPSSSSSLDSTPPTTPPITYYGKQTWEYAPQFALRSWLFVWLYAFPGWAARAGVEVYRDVVMVGAVPSSSSSAAGAAVDGDLLAFLRPLLTTASSVYVELSDAAQPVLARGAKAYMAKFPTLPLVPTVLKGAFARAAGIELMGVGQKTTAASSSSSYGMDTVLLYFICKITSALFACAAELYFILAMGRRFGPAAVPMAFAAVAFSAGTTITAISFLPSSFATLCYYVALGSWLRYDAKGRCGGGGGSSSSFLFLFGIIGPVVASVVIGWPFAGLVALPIALDVLYHDGLLRPLTVSALCLGLLGGAVFAVDSVYYERRVWTPWQLVAYNVFGGDDKGPELYGVEPWDFFFKNLFLNFNVLFLVCMGMPLVVLVAPKYALLAPPTPTLSSPSASSAEKDGAADGPAPMDEAVAKRLEALKAERAAKGTKKAAVINDVAVVAPPPPIPLSRLRQLLYVSPFFLWFVFWMRIPHKEERFMCPAYPFLVLGAVVGLMTAGRVGSEIHTLLVNNNADGKKPPAFIVSFIAAFSISCGGGNHNTKNSNATKKSTAKKRRPLHLLAIATSLVMCLACLVSQLRLVATADNYSGLQTAAIVTRDVLSEKRRTVAMAASKREGTGANIGGGGGGGGLPSWKGNSSSSSSSSHVRTLCVGVDWYRYPSSFFLPQHPAQEWRYCFLKTKAFTGALPMDFKHRKMAMQIQQEGGGGGAAADGSSSSSSSPSSSSSFIGQAASLIVKTLFAPSADRHEMNDLNKEVMPVQYCGGGDYADDELVDAAASHSFDQATLNKKALLSVCDAVMDTSDETVTGAALRAEAAAMVASSSSSSSSTDGDSSSFSSSKWAIVDQTVTSEWESSAGAASGGDPSSSSERPTRHRFVRVPIPPMFTFGVLDSGASSFITCRALWLFGIKREGCVWRPIVVAVKEEL